MAVGALASFQLADNPKAEIASIPYDEIKAEQPKIELYPELRAICGCESGLRQFNKNGEVLRGKVNPQDIGTCQLNENYWLKEAKELGFDIYIEQGNILMANWIYEKYGTKPWEWSKKCWKK